MLQIPIFTTEAPLFGLDSTVICITKMAMQNKMKTFKGQEVPLLNLLEH